MIFKSPIKYRIIISFTLVTLIISGIFALAIPLVFHETEERLVTRELDSKLLAYSKILDAPSKYPVDDPNVDYFAEHSPTPIPKEYDQSPVGLTELVSHNQALFIYKRIIEGRTFIAVMDQTIYEEYENSIKKVVLTGFLLSLICSALVGWALSKKILSPISQLSDEVLQLTPLAGSINEVNTLASHYANDEVGRLAQSFDHTFIQLNQSLIRERLFTSDVSHELRTSLMVLAVSSEILLDQAAPESMKAEHAKKIQKASNGMHKLVKAFLTLARINNDEQPHDLITLESAARNQFNQWQSLFQAKGISFHLIMDNYVETGLYSASFLEIVVSNLIQNALLYTNEGSVRLVLGSVRFLVEDTGIGIPVEDQQKIFKSFFRLNQHGEGLGLGLSLVQRICLHQNWHIKVESLLPTGTRFTVFLE